LPYSYVIDPRRRLMILRAFGRLTHAEVREARTRGVADPRFHRAYSTVVDFRDVTEFERSPKFVRELTERPIVARKAKIAILPKRGQPSGMARLFATYAQLMGRPVQLFTSVDAAARWLDIPLPELSDTDADPQPLRRQQP